MTGTRAFMPVDAVGSTARWAEAQVVFDQLCQLDPERIRRRVSRLQQQRPALGRCVRHLLAADDAAVGPVRTPQVPGYRIAKQIGEGGMGAVYLAAAGADPVAIKVLKPGMDAVRFAVEKATLAQLRHPNIARLLAAGSLADGRPYLVMEWVDGRPITERAGHVPIPVLLERFQSLCQAVACAHDRGVIHRDIKPANVLVSPQGEVKLLDFGIAKMLRPAFPGLAIDTRPEDRLLTPEYSSPEQLLGDPVTPGTDIYLLGLLLYELLAGANPLAGLTARRRLRAMTRRRECVSPLTAAARGAPLRTVRGWRRRRQLASLVLQALNVNPHHRPASARDLGDGVARLNPGVES
ncbi:MAG: serine/threonine-protein kinase [Pseudomonadota bacterium]